MLISLPKLQEMHEFAYSFRRLESDYPVFGSPVTQAPVSIKFCEEVAVIYYRKPRLPIFDYTKLNYRIYPC